MPPIRPSRVAAHGPEDDKVVLLKVSAERIHAWADGEELAGDPDTGLEVIQTEEEAEAAD